MKTNKELGALKLMEALSAVDAELLERSEKEVIDGRHRFVQRYAGLCAACFILIIAGAAYYGINRKYAGSTGGGMSGGAADTGTNMADAAPEAAAMEAPMNAEYEGVAMGVGSQADGLRAGEAEPVWLDLNSLDAFADKRIETGGGEPQEGEQAQLQAPVPLRDLGEDGLRETFVAGAKVPEGYGILPVKNAQQEMAGKAESGGQESSLLLGWSNGEYSLWLKLTQTKLTADMRFDAQPPIYTVQEKWRELIPAPEAGADGYAQFGLLYEDGLLVEYYGALSRQEAIELLESLAR